MKMAIVESPMADLNGSLDVWRSHGASPPPLGAVLTINRLTQRKENRGDGGLRKESRGRVKIKICIPQNKWVHVGNDLIADNYYTTQ